MAYDRQSAGLLAYQSHRIVRAIVRAAKVNAIYSGSCVGIDPDGRSISYEPKGKPTPQIGWYVLFYEDGYVSFSPAASFDGGYSLLGVELE